MLLSWVVIVSKQKPLSCNKMSLFFCSNTFPVVENDIQRVMIATSQFPFETYLGLPPLIGRGKRMAFAEIKSSVH